MKEVNYILHLNAVLQKFSKNDKISSSHRSLYLAFFELWNQRHFPTTITVNSKLVMSLAKIRSRTTYHKLLQDLKKWGYLQLTESQVPTVNLTLFLSFVLSGYTIKFRKIKLKTVNR